MNSSLFINGRFVRGGSRKAVINPSTGEVLCEAELALDAELDSALDSARRAFDSGIWKNLPFDKRRERLLKMASGIRERAGDLARLETLNSGKPIKETTFMDVPSAAQVFEETAAHFETYLKDEAPAGLPAEAESRLLREPLGVALLIVPWNYPLLIACWKLAAALAAGNCVVLKPSSLAPLSAIALAEIACEAGIPDGALNVVNSEGALSGEKLCGDGRVDIISFTGSNETGGAILAHSAAYPKKTLMELGGKSAALIFADTDLETAVNSCLVSVFLNQGQMCTAMSRILVEKNICDAFCAEFSRKARKIILGDAADFQTQMGPLISRTQQQRMSAWVDKARLQKAELLCGGKAPEGAILSKGFFFEPTVFAGVTPEMDIFRTEVFGPVVALGEFHGPEEAVRLCNDSDYGLAASVWTRDEELAVKVSSGINAGTVWVNTYGMFYPGLPYGGFKKSGFGKELGRAGFLEYTRLKNVIIDRSGGNKPLVNYWYGF
ncbi:MAG: aldehyde dehydrogenase family protein [Candidatus Omnitrophota bacterium]|jgi:acyl-CoA reductase-like NAD-dependent aldehyde dehydrogenase